MSNKQHDPFQPHSHDPNPEPPTSSPDFWLILPDAGKQQVTLAQLQQLPRTNVPNCFIVSTGHGTSGPFTFTGVRLSDFVAHFVPANSPWTTIEVLSADGFGNRVCRQELETEQERPILLADTINGIPLSRQQGLVRLIVPSETDDALRQVKWIEQIELK